MCANDGGTIGRGGGIEKLGICGGLGGGSGISIGGGTWRGGRCFISVDDGLSLRGIPKSGIMVSMEMPWDNLGNVVIGGGAGAELCGKLSFSWKINASWLFELESHSMSTVSMLSSPLGISEEIFLSSSTLAINLLSTISFAFLKAV